MEEKNVEQIKKALASMDIRMLQIVIKTATEELRSLLSSTLISGLKALDKTVSASVNEIDAGVAIATVVTWEQLAEIALSVLPEFTKGGIACSLVLRQEEAATNSKLDICLNNVSLPVLSEYPNGILIEELVAGMEKEKSDE